MTWDHKISLALACAMLNPRTVLEAAAELDPDTYVPILDALDEATEDLECDEAEPEDLEQWLTSHPVPVFERCPCCKNLEFHGEYIL